MAIRLFLLIRGRQLLYAVCHAFMLFYEFSLFLSLFWKFRMLRVGLAVCLLAFQSLGLGRWWGLRRLWVLSCLDCHWFRASFLWWFLYDIENRLVTWWQCLGLKRFEVKSSLSWQILTVLFHALLADLSKVLQVSSNPVRLCKTDMLWNPFSRMWRAFWSLTEMRSLRIELIMNVIWMHRTMRIVRLLAKTWRTVQLRDHWGQCVRIAVRCDRLFELFDWSEHEILLFDLFLNLFCYFLLDLILFVTLLRSYFFALNFLWSKLQLLLL